MTYANIKNHRKAGLHLLSLKYIFRKTIRGVVGADISSRPPTYPFLGICGIQGFALCSLKCKINTVDDA